MIQGSAILSVRLSSTRVITGMHDVRHVSEIDVSGKIKGHTSMVLRLTDCYARRPARSNSREIIELYHAPSGEKVDVKVRSSQVVEAVRVSSIRRLEPCRRFAGRIFGEVRSRIGSSSRSAVRDDCIPWTSEDHAQQRTKILIASPAAESPFAYAHITSARLAN